MKKNIDATHYNGMVVHLLTDIPLQYFTNQNIFFLNSKVIFLNFLN